MLYASPISKYWEKWNNQQYEIIAVDGDKVNQKGYIEAQDHTHQSAFAMQ